MVDSPKGNFEEISSQLEQTEASPNYEAFKKQITEIFNSPDKYSVKTESFTKEELASVNNLEAVSKILQEIIKDGIIDNNDKQLVEVLNSLLSNLGYSIAEKMKADILENNGNAYGDEKTSLLDGFNDAEEETIALGGGRLGLGGLPEISEASEDFVNEIFDGKIPDSPIQAITIISEYIKQNLSYDYFGFFLENKGTNITRDLYFGYCFGIEAYQKGTEAKVDRLIEIFNFCQENGREKLAQRLGKVISTTIDIQEASKPLLQEIDEPDINKKAQIINKKLASQFEAYELAQNELKNNSTEEELRFTRGNLQSIYDVSTPKEILENVGTGVCRNASMLLKRIYDKACEMNPNLGKNSHIMYVVDIEENHAYNLFRYIGENGKIEELKLDLTPIIALQSSNVAPKNQNLHDGHSRLFY